MPVRYDAGMTNHQITDDLTIMTDAVDTIADICLDSPDAPELADAMRTLLAALDARDAHAHWEFRMNPNGA